MVAPSSLVLVTGAAGFVGTELCEQLLAAGYRVRALVRSAARAQHLVGCEIVEGDITDLSSLVKAMHGVAGVFHIAALFREAKSDNAEYFRVNLDGTRNVYDAAIASGVSRIIHCSTTGVLGSVKNPPADESEPYAPCDAYQESKVAAEKLVLEYYRSGKVSGVIIRPAMIYGPRDTRLLKIFRMIARRRFFYVGPGNAWCHFIDVRDLAKGFILAMQHDELNAKIYTIAGKGHLRLHEAVALIAQKIGAPKPWLHIPLIPMQLLGDLCEIICKPFGIEPPLYRRRVDFYIKHRSFNVEAATRDLGFAPTQEFPDEVADIVAWYRQAGWL